MQSLFGWKHTEQEQIVTILDQLAAQGLSPMFVSIYQRFRSQGFLKAFELLEGTMLVALDGTVSTVFKRSDYPWCSTLRLLM